jgi:hypothetical protein
MAMVVESASVRATAGVERKERNAMATETLY